MAERAADVSYLLDRSMGAGTTDFSAGRDTGASSNALVHFAFTGQHNGRWPRDRSDYIACCLAVKRLPRHRKTAAVLNMLREAKRHIPMTTEDTW